MRGGRFFCVALPLILCVAAIITLLYAVLAGVSHRNLDMFTVDVSNLTIDASTARELISNFNPDNLEETITNNLPDGINLDDIKENLPDGVDLPDGATLDEIKDLLPDGTDIESLKNKLPDGESIHNPISGIGKVRRDLNARQEVITASTLDLGNEYEVTLWGYCRINSNGDRNCTDPEWDWASKHFDTSVLDDIASQTGLNISLPDELHDALEIFKPVTKWTQIGFAISLVALAVEFAIGVFANCTRVISCLVWLWAGLTTTIVIITAILATVTASVVVGAIESVGSKYNASASINTSFLATIWLGAAFSIAAGLFWIFTICCCKPETRAERKARKGFNNNDGEKLLPGSQRGGYGRLGDDNEMHGGITSAQHSPGFSPGFNHYGPGPQYPQNARSDLAYEPYSNRA